MEKKLLEALGNLAKRLVDGTNDAYNTWEREITEIIQHEWEADNSDAQGICEMHQSVIQKCWDDNLSPIQTFNKIKEADDSFNPV